MKRHILYIISAVLIALMPVSCRQDGLTDKGTGRLYVDIRHDFSLEEVRPDAGPRMKGAAEEEMVFSLEISGEGKEPVIVPDHRELAENPLELESGKYTLVARSVVNGDVDYSQPFYSGTKEFEILPDIINTVQVTCVLANVKVSAAFDRSISGNGQIKEYSLTVSNGEDAPLVFGSPKEGTVAEGENPAPAETGYLRATGILEWTLRIVNSEDNEFTESRTIEDVHGQQHYSFSFRLEEDAEFGGGYFRIVLDWSMNDKEESGTVWLGASSPEIKAEGFAIDADPVEVKAGDMSQKYLVFTQNGNEEKAGLRSVVVSHDNPLLLEAGLPYSAELIGASADVIASLGAAGISVPSVGEGAAELKADFGPFFGKLSLGEYRLSFKAVSCMGTYIERTLDFTVIADNETEAVSHNPWAYFAELTGKWFSTTRPEGLSFQYRKASDEVWTDFTGEVTPDETSRTYTGRITGLLPQTEYVWRTVSAKDKADGKELPEMTFVTGHTETIPNLNFDSWKKDGDAWMPNDDNYIWDSANKGTASYGYVPTTPEEVDVAIPGEGKKAVKLTSMAAKIVFVNTFAAGNLYTGKFGAPIISISNPGATLEWGVPFTAKPLALRGYYKYIPKTVNHGNYNEMSGKTDICQMQIFLLDMDGRFQINTAEKVFLTPDRPEVIAYGTFEDSKEMSSYETFTVNVDYKDDRTPKYIAIVAAASKYGDYFTGGDGSTLYLDEFELVYDPAELEK